MKKAILLFLVSTFVLLVGIACDDTSENEGPLAIVGEYSDNFGGSHSITNDTWTAVTPPWEEGGEETVSVANISTYDNGAEYIIAENDGADTWSRYDWTYNDGNLYYCQIEYAAASSDAAEANESADRTDPANSGCGGFSWTMLTAAE